MVADATPPGGPNGGRARLPGRKRGVRINAFHVIGSLFAAWALLVAALGITREGFPTKGQAPLVGAVSVLLAVGAIGSAIITSALEEEEGAEEAAGAERREAAAGGRELRLSADPGGDFRFDKQTLESSPGRVTLVMANPSSIPHNVSIEGGGVDEEGNTVQKDGTSTVSATLRPGRYEFYCSVPGHRQGGMEGRLTIR
jgi:plastocyanin